MALNFNKSITITTQTITIFQRTMEGAHEFEISFLNLLHPTQWPPSKTDKQMLHVVSGTLVLIGSAWDDFSGSFLFLQTNVSLVGARTGESRMVGFFFE